MSITFILLWIVVLNIFHINAYKFLLYPNNMQSHLFVFSKFGAALTEKGHEIDLLVASNAHLPFSIDPFINIIRYPVRFEKPFFDPDHGTARISAALDALKSGYWKTLDVVRKQYEDMMTQQHAECEDVLQNDGLLDILHQRGYDLMVIDNCDLECTPVVPYKLNLPIALLSTDGPYWGYRIPALPSVSPHVLLPFTQPMNFFERFVNLVEFCIAELCIYCYASNDYVKRFVPERPAITSLDIFRSASLVFIRHHDLLQFPLPNLPHIVQVGDLTVEEPSMLPNEYEALFSSTQRHVILFSMGSLLKQFPEDILAKFCDAFRLLEHRILVIWKSTPLSNCPSNVFARSWLPQNDLLGHSRVKLFITHCGLKSYIESAYYGTPMIGFPILMDQIGNCANMQGKGMGLTMDITSFTPAQLADNLNKVLNATYLKNAQRISVLMHNTQSTSKERVVFWMEHVVKFGADHLRSTGFDLNIFHFFMLDILAVLVLIILMSISCCICCHRFKIHENTWRRKQQLK